MKDTAPPPERPPAQPSRAATGPPIIESTELLVGSRELVIQHGSERYRLMLTAQNKLILTK